MILIFSGFRVQFYADVAELVDALVSGTSDSNVLGVQVSSSAFLKVNYFDELAFESKLLKSMIETLVKKRLQRGSDVSLFDQAKKERLAIDKCFEFRSPN